MSAMEISLVACCLMQFLALVAVFRIARDERKESGKQVVAWQNAHAHSVGMLEACQRELVIDDKLIEVLTRQYGEVRQLAFMYSYGIHENVARLHEAELEISRACSTTALALIRRAHEDTLALLMTDPEKWGKPAPGTVA